MRKVLAWPISNTSEADFYAKASNEAIYRFGVLGIMNSDRGSQFTSIVWIDLPKRGGIRILIESKRFTGLTRPHWANGRRQGLRQKQQNRSAGEGRSLNQAESV